MPIQGLCNLWIADLIARSLSGQAVFLKQQIFVARSYTGHASYDAVIVCEY